MSSLVSWIIFLHILSALTFFLAHGASAAMVFKIRSETDFNRIRAMLDLSGMTIGLMSIAFLIMGLSGLALPFFLKLWKTGWVWTSIVLLIVVIVYMGVISQRHYKTLRKLVGLPYLVGGKQFPAEEPASQEEVLAHLKKINAGQVAWIAYGIPVVIVWLMVFKPF